MTRLVTGLIVAYVIVGLGVAIELKPPAWFTHPVERLITRLAFAAVWPMAVGILIGRQLSKD